MSFQSKALARLLAVAGAVLVAALIPSAAFAGETAPGYEEWSGCPTQAENPNIVTCVRADITGGHFQMGNKDVPIEETITLTGGLNAGGEEFDGEIIPAKQKVPGGLVGLTGLTWLVEFLGSDALTLYAVTELAGTPKLFNEPIELPIKVHLINPALGSSCYVGSDSDPIDLRLTYGTTEPPPPNEPISGTFPEFAVEEPEGSVRLDNGTLVDNSFAAPGANGCKLILFGFIPISINGLVNTASGLPAAAGTNETTQDTNLSIVGAEFVYP
jgi:hypothetical protein